MNETKKIITTLETNCIKNTKKNLLYTILLIAVILQRQFRHDIHRL